MKAKLKALAVIIAGLFLIVVAFMVLSGGKDVISINASALDSSANGELVYVAGVVKPNESLEDALFGVSENESIALKRVVEMYQWQEAADGSYTQVWSEELIDSALFADASSHQNPKEKPVESLLKDAQSASLGVYNISARLKQKIVPSSWEALAVTPEQYSALPSSGKTAFKLFDGKLFYGLEPQNPRIGDMQIRFERSPVMSVSIIAELAGGQLVPDTQTGDAIHKVREGIVSKDVMLETIDLSGGMLRWIFAGLGLVVMLVGGVLLMKSGRAKVKSQEADDFPPLEEDDGFAVEQDDGGAPSASMGEADMAVVVGGVALGSIVQADDDEFGSIAPMKTPGMDDAQVPNEQDHRPTAVDSYSQPAPEPEVVQPEQDDSAFGMDYTPDIEPEPIASVQPEPSPEPTEYVQEQAEQTPHMSAEDPAFETMDDDIGFVEPEEKEASTSDAEFSDDDISFLNEPESVEEVAAAAFESEGEDTAFEVAENDTVQAMPEQYEPTEHSDELEDVSGEMFMLDDTQDEGSSEPVEVDGDGKKISSAENNEDLADNDLDDEQEDLEDEDDEEDDDEFFFLDDDDEFEDDEDEDEDENEIDDAPSLDGGLDYSDAELTEEVEVEQNSPPIPQEESSAPAEQQAEALNDQLEDIFNASDDEAMPQWNDATEDELKDDETGGDKKDKKESPADIQEF